MNNTTLKRIANQLRIMYPLWVITAVLSLIVIPARFIEGADPEATVANIQEHEFLFRLSVVGSLLTQVFFIVIPIWLFRLFRGVSPVLCYLMLAFALVSVPITMHLELYRLSALSILDEPAQVEQLLQLAKRGLLISYLFWGLWLFPLGRLVYISGYFPRLIGILVYLGGLGYLVGSLGRILLPEFDQLHGIGELLTFGETLFIVWFVFAGIRIRESSPTDSTPEKKGHEAES